VTQVNLSSLSSSSSSSSSTHTHTHSTIKTLPTHWATLRPEQLSPLQFVALTEWIYIGRLQCKPVTREARSKEKVEDEVGDSHINQHERDDEEIRDNEEEEKEDPGDTGVILGNKVWRRLKHGAND